MKIIKYVLTSEGTVPEYVVDGGYLACKNNGVWPQDLDLVGIANDSATEYTFANKAALTSYVESKNLEFKNPITKESISISTIVDNLWEKLG